MKFNDFYYNDEYKENRNMFKVLLKKMYNSNRGFYIRKNMEFEEFENICYMSLIQYWNFDNYRGELNTYLGSVIDKTTLKFYQTIDCDMRKLNHDDNMERFDKPVQEGENPITVIYNDEKFSESKCINFIIEAIPNELDKQICKAYLLDIKMSDIGKAVGLSQRTVQYRIKDKYMKLIQDRFTEYKNSIA